MRSRRHVASVILAIAVLGLILVACLGGEPSIDDAVMAKSLDGEYKAVEETTAFSPTETFHCSVKVSNLEKGDKVTAKWFHGEEFLKEVSHSLPNAGSGYVGLDLWLEDEEESWAIGDYKVEIYLNDELAKTVNFSVQPPEGATPSRVIRVVTAKSVDENYKPIEPTTLFAPTDVVHCSVNADLGLYSRLTAKWYHYGELLEDLITTVIMEENISDTHIDLYLEPKPELAEGNYTVEIYLDGKLAKSVDFTVKRPDTLLGPIVFAEGVTEDGELINPASTFPAGTTEVYAIFDYQGMSDGMEWEDKWYLEGEEVAPGTRVWEVGESGTTWVYLQDSAGLPSGNYKLEIYVEGQLLQSGTFVIEEEAKPTPGADWRLYTSEALGFSIQYPPDWGVEEEEGGVNFEATAVARLSITVIPEVEMSAQALAEASLEALREDYPDLETTYAGTYSTEAAEWWETDIAITEQGIRLSFVLLYTVQEGTAYVITANALEAEFDQWADDFVAMVDRFRFLPEMAALTVEYDVEETITLVNDGPGAATRLLLWVALIRDVEPYQRVVSMEIVPEDFRTVTDEYGNLYAEFEFNDLAPGTERTVRTRYQVEVNELDFDLGDCEGPLPSIFIGPESYVESDAEHIVTLATDLEQGKVTACEEVEAFYNYVGDNVSYAGYDPGDNGALHTLEELEGDCTDFADLMMALSRAGDIPARFLEGVTCCTDGDYEPGEIKHDRLEVYLPDRGWVPMDPTWGRFPVDRETYLAGTTPDYIVVTQGRNLSVLEGYGYFYYEWWWGAVSTEVSHREEWRVEIARE